MIIFFFVTSSVKLAVFSIAIVFTLFKDVVNSYDLFAGKYSTLSKLEIYEKGKILVTSILDNEMHFEFWRFMEQSIQQSKC